MMLETRGCYSETDQLVTSPDTGLLHWQGHFLDVAVVYMLEAHLAEFYHSLRAGTFARVPTVSVIA